MTPPFFIGDPKGLTSDPKNRIIGDPKGLTSDPQNPNIGDPTHLTSDPKSMKKSKNWISIKIFSKNDKVLETSFRSVFSISNTQLSIWGVYLQIFEFFFSKWILADFVAESYDTFDHIWKTKFILYQKINAGILKT